VKSTYCSAEGHVRADNIQCCGAATNISAAHGFKRRTVVSEYSVLRNALCGRWPSGSHTADIFFFFENSGGKL
jgi:hypothetical protein